MCLCVYANGSGSGVATCVSVFAHLNREEYDDQLKWPFRAWRHHDTAAEPEQGRGTL